MLNVLASLAANTRRETFNDTEHLVVPVIALVEGVVWPSNAPGPELALASEFGKAPEGWDGRPVLIGHPVRNGQQVSANKPDIWETEVVGQIFNTKVEDAKLKTEAWINLETVKELGGEVEEVIDKVENGDIVEVSTGLFADVDPRPGKFNNEEFVGTWQNVIPDHLAILPEGVKGACSVEDGCGTNRTLNMAIPSAYCVKNLQLGAPVDRALGLRSLDSCPCGGACPCKLETKMLFDEDELLKEIFDRGGQDHYNDAFDALSDEGARRLARLSAYAVTDREDGLLRRLLTKFRGGAAKSDRDKRAALDAAMSMNGEDFFFIVAVEDDNFVFEKGFSGKLIRRGFRIEDDGTVVLVGEPTQVRPETEFVPVKVKEDTMTTEARANALIANEATRFGEDHREWLMGLDEAQLELLEPLAALEPDPDEAGEQPSTAEAYIASIQNPEMQAILNSGLSLHRTRKENLVAKIKASSEAFTEDELHAKELSELEKLATLASPGGDDDFSGAGGTITTAEAESRFAAAPPKLDFGKE